MGKIKVLFVVVGAFVIAYMIGTYWDLKPETKYDHVVQSGETAVLTAAKSPTVWIAVQSRDAYEIQVAMSKNDESFLREAGAKQTAFPLAVGVRVKVTGESSNRRRIEILDGPMTGKTGWVEFEYLRPLRRGEF
jgi:hypothetical protein